MTLRVDCRVDKEHKIQLQHTMQLHSECVNAVDMLDRREERNVVRNAISKMLNLGSRTMGRCYGFWSVVGSRGGVPTHEVAASFCESTAKVPVVLERRMTNKNASQQ
ncbi:hypothetical protein PF008_g26774 [Phytophthora fragariae]|uniref:Uncharacterized protein n=1 Tax=Phytophthora fragariae TaxID=53985 RepID=A0A6G0QGZ1_9STRA|nr:hypothetical protein PF008_g26774 [Phytophthora fragariae]